MTCEPALNPDDKNTVVTDTAIVIRTGDRTAASRFRLPRDDDA
jgi:hypothetical protein